MGIPPSAIVQSQDTWYDFTYLKHKVARFMETVYMLVSRAGGRRNGMLFNGCKGCFMGVVL